MRAFITGGSRGIGLAIARAVLPRVTELTLLARDKDRLQQTAERLMQRAPAGCSISTITVDLADLSATRAELQRWQAEQPARALDFVVLNAGTFTEADLSAISFDDYLQDLNVNLNSQLLVARELIPSLRLGNRRRLFITGSTSAYEPDLDVPAYTMAKAALRSMAMNLRAQLKPDRIGVTFLAPGPTNTDMWAGEDIPPEHLLAPEDVGQLVATCLDLTEQAVVEEIILQPMDSSISAK